MGPTPRASGVNDAGIVVGNSETTDGGGGLTTHAFADDLATHTMSDLGTLPGGTSSAATAINADGLVVGTQHGDRRRHPSRSPTTSPPTR